MQIDVVPETPGMMEFGGVVSSDNYDPEPDTNTATTTIMVEPAP